jgi:DNA-binding XRE family transcriptional regulator
MTRLEYYRTRARLTRATVAVMSGISEQTLYLYETGKGGKSSILIQKSLADTLETLPEKLFDKNGRAR